MRWAACLLFAALLAVVQAAPAGRRLQEGRVGSAIAGGQTGTRNRYRWNASLRQSTGPLRTDPFCGAVLISKKVLLTTASCVLAPKLGTPPLPRDAFRFPQVRLDAFERRGGEYEIRAVKAVLAPSGWQRGSPKDDIALLLLDRVSRMTPIRLPKLVNGSNPAVAWGTELTALGWGKVNAPSNEPDLPRYLQEVKMPLQRQYKCKYFYPDIDVWNGKQCICAGKNRASTGVCSGDSGGPLFRPGRNVGEDLLVGLNSFNGNKGCAGGIPSGFTNVAQYRAWIQGGLDIYEKFSKVTEQYKVYRNPRYYADPAAPLF